MNAALPRAARPFLDFPRFLRQHGFAIAPEQTVAFMHAVKLLGPRSMRSLYHAAHATLAPAPERRSEFDDLFHRFFWQKGEGVIAARSLPEPNAPVKEGWGGAQSALEARKANRSGEAASRLEALTARRLAGTESVVALRRLRRRAREAVPHRLSLRHIRHPHGRRLDLRRSLPEIIRNDGDIVDLARAERQRLPRRIVLLIDISGSMKASTDAYLEFAHTLTQILPSTETFAFGTRLTRLTAALRGRNKSAALAQASELVPDWDGGTRIGASLNSFLSAPRFSSLAHGAVVLVISDGLERGDHLPMIEAAERLARRSARFSWLSPLAGDPRFRPETLALKALIPIVGRIADGSSIESLVNHLLALRSMSSVRRGVL